LIEPDATPSALLEVHLKMTIIFPVVAAAPVLKVKANQLVYHLYHISITSNCLWSLKKIVDPPLLLTPM
jgi:hypothetical protein